MIPPRSRLLLVPLILFSVASGARAGKLDDFEREVKKPPKAEDAPKTTSSDETEDDDDISFEFLWETLKGGGGWSWQRVSGAEAEEPRGKGEPAIPFLRLDAAFQDVRSDVAALDFRVETGYGPLGLEGRITRYREKDPRDYLRLSHVFALYRMSFTKHVEVDLGGGPLFLEGDSSASGSATTAALRVYGSPWGFEFRPAWGWIAGNPVDDYDTSVLWVRRGFSARAGYRRVRAGEADLDGPYLGVSFHY